MRWARLLPRRLARVLGTTGAVTGLFVVVGFAFMWPVLLGGKALSPAGMLYFVPPWTPLKPPDVGTYLNPTLSDIPTEYYPWWQYTREALRGFSLPEWNTFALAGTPFFANPQTTIASPFSIPLWLLPLVDGLAVAALLRLVVGALGGYLLGRELGLRTWPAIAVGLAFGFSPFSTLWLGFPLWSVLAMLPWAVLLVERLLNRGRGADVLFLASVLAVVLLSGHPGSQLHVYGTMMLYALVRVLTIGRPLAVACRRVGLVFAASLLGAALAAFLLLPVALAIPGTAGAQARAAGGPIIPQEAVRTLFFPDWWGRPSGIYSAGPFNYNERTVYIGTVVLILAVLAVFSRQAWRRKLPFLVLGAVGFEASFGLQPTQWLLEHVPIISGNRNARLSVLLVFSGAVLAGFAVQELAESRARRRTTMLAAAIVAVVAVLGLTASSASLTEIRAAGNHFRTGNDFALANVVEVISVAWWGLFGLSLVAILALRTRVSATALAVVVVALIGLDAARFAHGYNPMPPDDRAFPSATPAVRYLQEHAGFERIVGIGVVLPPDTSMAYGLRDVRGYDTPKPDLRFLRVFRLVNPTQATNDWLSVPALTPTGLAILSALDARYVVLPPSSPRPDARSLSLRYRGPDADIYRNAGAVGRSYVPASVVSVESEEAGLAQLAAPDFLPRRDALIEGRAISAGRGRAAVVRDDGDAVDVRVNLTRGGLVVLADSLDDGWRAESAGRELEVVRVNGVLRGVELPAGEHIVRWRYRAPGLIPGSAISLAAVVVIAIWAFVLMRRRRHSRAASA